MKTKTRIEIDYNEKTVTIFDKNGDMDKKPLKEAESIIGFHIATLTEPIDIVKIHSGSIYVVEVGVNYLLPHQQKQYLKNIEANGQYKN